VEERRREAGTAGRRGALAGRVALVTGGAGGLGRAVVAAFLRAGASVHVPLQNPSDALVLRDTLGAGATEVYLHPGVDLTHPESVETLFHAVGRVDILLNLAGGFSMGPIEETDVQTWSQMWSMNATSAFLCARSAFPRMRAEGWGRIVNISALPALQPGSPGMAAYGAAKAAVLHLTQSLAQEGVHSGITVNALLPSILDTPTNRRALPHADTSRWLPPSEIAKVLLFLASDDARLVNGSSISLTLGG
jgi:NAD(P)-dependent dehydrogenase (short-subunit alcohol dehydrogenase family)